jgi:hypothetical protein
VSERCSQRVQRVLASEFGAIDHDGDRQQTANKGLNMGNWAKNVLLITVLVSAAVGCADSMTETRSAEDTAAPLACNTSQIFGASDHAGRACGQGLQGAMTLRGAIVTDPDARTEDDDLGFYSAHQSAALTRPGWVWVGGKTGYTDLFDKGTQTWSVKAAHWELGALGQKWEYVSKWRPYDTLDAFGTTNGYESLYQPAYANGSIYAPDGAGQLVRLDPTTGAVTGRIDPFAGTAFSGDALVTVNSALAVDETRGDVYYTAVAWQADGDVIPRASWLVRVHGDDTAEVRAWETVAPNGFMGIRSGVDVACTYPFQFATPVPPKPWPPSVDAVGPSFGCGPQRPPVNSAPAISGDKVYVMTGASNATIYAHVVALDRASLAPVWATSLRESIADYCGVIVPFNDASNSNPNRCRFGARLGVDPQFNELVHGRLPSIEENAIVVAPDGSLYVSSYSGSYNNDRGHLHHIGANGGLIGLGDYGWETIPALIPDGAGGWSLPIDGGPSLGSVTTRVSADLTHRLFTTSIPRCRTCEANDWVDGQAAFDAAGNQYGINASGRVARISSSGAVTGLVQITDSMEPLSTEMSWGIDDAGQPVLYVPYAGQLFAVGGEQPGHAAFVAQRLSSRRAERTSAPALKGEETASFGGGASREPFNH